MHERKSNLFRVRLARREELFRIRQIEDEAGKLFSGLGLIDESKDESFPLNELTHQIDLGLVWVCGMGDLPPVGFLIASEWDASLYIEEMDVLPSHSRRGIGTRLLSHVCDWARGVGHRSVILSTFSNVPWNGPFYQRNGFRGLSRNEHTPRMLLQRDREIAHGLAVEFRVFMEMELVQNAV